MSFAQKSQGFHGGITIGACGTQVDGDWYGGFDKGGIMAGFVVNYPLSKTTTFQAEIKYFQKGSRKNINYDKGDYNSYIMRLQYIEMPFALAYHFTVLDKYNLSAELGLAPAYLISSYEERDGYEILYGVPFKKIELSGQYGVNYHVSEKFHMGFKYHYSMFPIRDFPDGTNPKPGRIVFNKGQYNNIVSFSLYYIV